MCLLVFSDISSWAESPLSSLARCLSLSDFCHRCQGLGLRASLIPIACKQDGKQDVYRNLDWQRHTDKSLHKHRCTFYSLKTLWWLGKHPLYGVLLEHKSSWRSNSLALKTVSLCIPLQQLAIKSTGPAFKVHAVSINPWNRVKHLVINTAKPSVISLLSPGSHLIHNVFKLQQTEHTAVHGNPWAGYSDVEITR